MCCSLSMHLCNTGTICQVSKFIRRLWEYESSGSTARPTQDPCNKPRWVSRGSPGPICTPVVRSRRDDRPRRPIRTGRSEAKYLHKSHYSASAQPRPPIFPIRGVKPSSRVTSQRPSISHVLCIERSSRPRPSFQCAKYPEHSIVTSQRYDVLCLPQ
ncbi:hypothetical protein DAEQUDRAFT_29402 [Daedalea quercina L-15889]|uniref:Uncharacterized protein n=1 Tax=Daedalea quercina L-15889 TaxID=1314783 RepID=A0A165SPG1_9APHY|nr:hypothetical protein DAEQUDRAFT_29402 [Daedalea quercina L-15889]